MSPLPSTPQISVLHSELHQILQEGLHVDSFNPDYSLSKEKAVGSVRSQRGQGKHSKVNPQDEVRVGWGGWDGEGGIGEGGMRVGGMGRVGWGRAGCVVAVQYACYPMTHCIAFCLKYSHSEHCALHMY